MLISKRFSVRHALASILVVACILATLEIPSRRADHILDLVRSGQPEALMLTLDVESLARVPHYKKVLVEVACAYRANDRYTLDEVLLDKTRPSLLDYIKGYQRVRIGWRHDRCCELLLTVYGVQPKGFTEVLKNFGPDGM